MTHDREHPEAIRRSMLFVPANNTRALDKAQSLPADAVVIDLEDAVADDNKQRMRDALPSLIAERAYGERELWVRINAVDTPAGHDDLRATAQLSITGLVLPKVENPELVHRTGVLLGDAKQMIVMIETPLGVVRASDTLSAHPQVAAAMLGLQDLRAALRLPHPQQDRLALMHALQHTVLAARAAGVGAIDSVIAEFRDLEPLRAECAQARAFGFDGKAAIHPAQLGTINATFSVTEDDIAEAQAIVDCFDQASARGESVATFNGRMVEALHARAAHRTLDRAAREARRDL